MSRNNALKKKKKRKKKKKKKKVATQTTKKEKSKPGALSTFEQLLGLAQIGFRSTSNCSSR
jgi:hypothetical protein